MNEKMIVQRVNNFVKRKQHEQGLDGDEKPYVDFSRNTSWAGESCRFCGSSTSIHEVGGRYIACDWDEDMEVVPGSQWFFCGNCLERLEKQCEMVME